MRKKSSLIAKIFVIVILGVFIASAFAVTQFKEDEVDTANKFKIGETTFYVLEDGRFATGLEKKNFISLLSDPRELGDIAVEGDLKINAGEVFISYDPNLKFLNKAESAMAQIAQVTQLNSKTLRSYLVDADPIDPNVPLKTCKDATINSEIIELRVSNLNKIHSESNCIVAEAKAADDLVKVASKLTLYLAGIKI